MELSSAGALSCHSASLVSYSRSLDIDRNVSIRCHVRNRKYRLFFCFFHGREWLAAGTVTWQAPATADLGVARTSTIWAEGRDLRESVGITHSRHSTLRLADGKRGKVRVAVLAYRRLVPPGRARIARPSNRVDGWKDKLRESAQSDKRKPGPDRLACIFHGSCINPAGMKALGVPYAGYSPEIYFTSA
jgi:hypothetical protein